MSKLRVGINGFGRIGRVLFRQGFEKFDVVAINDLTTAEQAAHLLKYDSAHGGFQGEVKCEDNNIVVNGKAIPFTSERDPAILPWKEREVDLVLECTGVFVKNREALELHLKAGAKKVLVSAPAGAADATFVYGVNHESYDAKSHNIVSNASCTTNCLAPMAKVLHQEFGIERGLMTTIHSYTLDQRVLDAAHSDPRRSRAAALSMIPTTTGAAKAVGLVLPELNGKIDGFAVRVPTPNVSMVDFVFTSSKELNKDAINSALQSGANGVLKGVLACSEEPLVSVDFNGNKNSSIVDLPSTMVSGSNMAKVVSWYDNETGFSCRMVDFAMYMAEKGL